MIIFQQIYEYLSQEFSADYWSDYAVLFAIDLVQKLTHSDWNQLKSCWRDRPQEWQYRCAEIISFFLKIVLSLKLLLMNYLNNCK